MIVKRIRYLFVFGLLFLFLWRLFRPSDHSASNAIENPNLPIKPESSSSSKKSEYQEFLKVIHSSNALYRQDNNAINAFRSSYECIGRQNIAKANEARSCLFKNICYHMKSNHYFYYLPIKEPVFYDYEQGPMYEFPHRFIELNALHIFHSGLDFTPEIRIQAVKPKNAAWMNDLHVVWANWATDFNFGHLVFEELGSIYVDLVRLGLSKRNPQLINIRNSVNASHPLYQKFTNFFGKVITKKPILKEREYYESISKGKEFICFSDLMVSSSSRLFLDFTDTSNLGKETIWKQFRDDILREYGLDPKYKPRKIKITFLKKSKSHHPLNAQKTREHYRDIANLDELVLFTRKRYPKILVQVLDPTLMSLKDQLKSMQETSILVSPNGGLSMIGVFLPVKSHAIIMDYYVSHHKIYNSYIPYKPGNSGSMEISFWNLFPHFKKHYYQILDPMRDMKWDVLNSTNARDDASIVVDFDRFEFLVNHAILEMSL